MKTPEHSAAILPALVLLTGCLAVRPPGNVRTAVPREVVGVERADEPDAAEAFERARRLNGTPDGFDPRAAWETARQRAGALPRYSVLLDDELPRATALEANVAAELPEWEELGPGNIGGRTRAILIDGDARILYAAGVSGGVWKSIDEGASWRPVADVLANIAVNALTFDPQDHRIIYAGTGEGYFREEVRGTGLPLRGGGIFRTEDAGGTWTRMESTAGPDFYWVNDLVVSPHDSGRIYAATRTGVWRSADRGQSWRRLLDPAVKGGCLDLAMRTDGDGDFLFASCGTFTQATVYRQKHAESDDAFEAVLSPPSMGLTSLAIAPSNGNIVYALAASNSGGPGGRFNQGLLAVFRSEAGGEAGSWQTRTSNADADVADTLLLTNPIVAVQQQCDPDDPDAHNQFVTMGWYTNVIAVDPTDPDRVWAAGVDLFRSDDGGRNWSPVSYWWTDDATPSFAHADQHALVFDPAWDGASNQTLYAGNDGGIYRTTNALASAGHGIAALCNPEATSVRWKPLNHGYGVTQFYNGAVSPDGRFYLAGAQDNGTILGSERQGKNGWRRIAGGDGAYVAVDANDPRVIYAEYQWGFVLRSTDGGQTFGAAVDGLADAGFLFVTPLTMDPQEPRRLWVGGSRLWRSDDGATHWTPASAGLPLSAGSVSAIAVAPGRSERVVAGTSQGLILRNDAALSANGGAVWTSATPRAGWVSSIAFQSTNPDVAYATYAGFGGAHVWKSIDGGRTWSAIDGEGALALPDIPVHSIVVDPSRSERLFIGTDLGVFVTTDGGASWMVENSGFANVVTEWLTIGESAEGTALFAFTHGRGAWRATLSGRQPRRHGLRR